jgi:hypothetical protein
MAFAVECPRTAAFDGSPSSRIVDYLTYTSQFHNNLMAAIKANAVTECHLFALFFQFFAARNKPGDTVSNQRVYKRGILEVMKSLLLQNGAASRHQARLQYLYSYMLSFLRRVSCWDYFFSRLQDATLPYEMYVIAKSLPVPHYIPDLRATEGFPASFWLRGGGEIKWRSLLWTVMNDVETLRAALLLISHSATTLDCDFTENITEVLQSVSKNISEMQSLDCVAFLIDEVNPSKPILISSG